MDERDFKAMNAEIKHEKMTAVEFLIEELIESQYFPYGTPIVLIEQAKQMEKQQMIDFADSYGTYLLVGGTRSAASYNETFKNTNE